MELDRCMDTAELTDFLKQDYANNLYFFTYLDDIRRPGSDVAVFVAKDKNSIILALLISPAHCCIAATNSAHIDSLAGRIPPVHSTHILGRSDHTLKLLSVISGSPRKPKPYTFCRLHPQRLPRPENLRSSKAAPADLDDLVRFYHNNEMLAYSDRRLAAILNWGTVYFLKKDGRIVSCALTTTETGDTAMAGGVFTKEAHRRQGFSRDCTLNLCRDLTERRKEVRLFYDSADAALAKMYGDSGFERTGGWVLATVAGG